jgi:hypothetical protein
LIGFDYAQLGGALLHQWGLPETLSEPVQLQVTPQQVTEYSLEASIVHLAGVLSEVNQSDVAECDSLVSLAHPFTWQITGLVPDQCMEVQTDVECQLDGVMFMIFPGSKTMHAGSRLAIEV